MKSRMKLEYGQIVEYRLGRAGREAVDWDDWQKGPIQVDHTPAGEACWLAPENQQGWAEYDPRVDCCEESDETATFMAEDWYMEIRKG